ncbi:hypothetical protein KP509_08G046000 [Ceratopteris richardii]|uniref:Uncharacterized protein n=1 Tax=Ceratopteris richardii TaxID=49495 RepID=A0A8T2UG23_CERRI|nr:hypothetical protein KP509_08G046000 [Ceratopteris richardii]
MAACDTLLCLAWVRPYSFHHLIWTSIMEKKKRHVVHVQKDAKKFHVYSSVIILWLKSLSSKLTEIQRNLDQPPPSTKRNPSTLVRKKLLVKRARVKGDSLQDIRDLPIVDQGYAGAKGTDPPLSSHTYARKRAPNPHVLTHHSTSYNPSTPPPSPPIISTPHASPPVQIPSPLMSPFIQTHHTPTHVSPIPIPPPMQSPNSPPPPSWLPRQGSHMHSTSTQPMHSSTPPLAPCSSTNALPVLENIHIANIHARNSLESLSQLNDYHKEMSSFMGVANQQVLQLQGRIADL